MKTSHVVLIGAQALVALSLLLPEIAAAQAVGGADMFSGVTDFLRALISLLVLQWARLLAIGVLVWEAFKWWKGRADFMDLCVVVVACFVAAFAPAIVSRIWSSAGGSIL